MTKLFLTLALCLSAIAPARAQYEPTTETIPYFTTFYSFSLSGAAGAFSITVPAANDRRVFMSQGYVWCSVASVITQTLGGTVTGGSTLTAVALNMPGITPKATAKQGATFAGGSQIGPSYTLPAATSLPLQLNNIVFERGGAANAYKVSTDSITGTCVVSVIWGEKNR